MLYVLQADNFYYVFTEKTQQKNNLEFKKGVLTSAHDSMFPANSG